MKGIIFLWYGAIGNIPTGWALCDGTQGTPNLRNRFVSGAGLTYNPGDVGFPLPFHAHPFTSDGHEHTIPSGAEILAGTDFETTVDTIPASGTTGAAGLAPYHALAYIMKLP